MLSASSELTTYRSFDGGHVEAAHRMRPDRYRMLEQDLAGAPRIARGGGYSYAAASFGAGSVVLEMDRFNRVLELALTERTLTVEAGMPLSRLLELALPQGLWLPVLPGHPAITVGGCIAADVHGKNPSREGTFSRWVRELELLHPRHGRLRLRPGEPLFQLTCGGYGTTGIITTAKLQLEPLPGNAFSVHRFPVESLEQANRALAEPDDALAFRYSWHDPRASPRGFGKGLVFEGRFVTAETPGRSWNGNQRWLDSSRRARLPFSLFGPATRALTGFHWLTQSLEANPSTLSLRQALFPLALRPEYFLLYGRRGLAEYQVLVPTRRAPEFLDRLRELVLRERPPAVMLALRRFQGEPRLLCFDGAGLCLTLDLVRSASGLAFLRRLDELTISMEARPNLVKDSRLPREVVQRCFPQYDAFRERLLEHDRERLFRSELSARLAL